ncbi:hypothetical protein K8F61_09535 [Microbacterium resistens]|uniref:DUF5666 domain-containing protein n=1 Tax=Microbacterium resistens TaxID=156977 RepID=A0ABY3RZ76_9MICO|nr:hypothetical protein [Microbacterium resistens]UGS28369.1 hypothetical protein K8F61_09535 [Microbacterium resistens]
MKVSPSDGAYSLENELGSTIRIGDRVWVKPTGGDWVVGDPTSSDEKVAALSSGAQSIEQFDPTNRFTIAKGTLNVVGTQEVLGQQVFVITGRHETAGTTVELSMQVTPDYAVLGITETTADVTTMTEVMEWNKKQDIQAPM